MKDLKFRAWNKNRREMWITDLRDYGPRERLDYILSHGNLMQFTGRKDKHGVEIYEKDIVRYSTGEVWKVIWSTRLAGFIYENRVSKNLNSWEQTMDMHEVEVIGNIYENPDLLEDK